MPGNSFNGDISKEMARERLSKEIIRRWAADGASRVKKLSRIHGPTSGAPAGKVNVSRHSRGESWSRPQECAA